MVQGDLVAPNTEFNSNFNYNLTQNKRLGQTLTGLQLGEGKQIRLSVTLTQDEGRVEKGSLPGLQNVIGLKLSWAHSGAARN